MSVGRDRRYAVLAGLWLGLISPSLALPTVGEPDSLPAAQAVAFDRAFQTDHATEANIFANPLSLNPGIPASPWPAANFRIEAWPFEKPKSQPFGYEASGPLTGGLQSKWRAVKVQLGAERRILRDCRADSENCPAAAKLLLSLIDRAMLRDGKARVAEINRAINLTIRFVSDAEQYGVEEAWTTPLKTFAQRAGDCEDYAIAKYVALQELGFASRDLRLVVVRDENGEGHAVAAVRFSGEWLILDNRQLALQSDAQIANMKPLFVIDDGGAKHLVVATLNPPKLPSAPAAPLLVSVPMWPSSVALL